MLGKIEINDLKTLEELKEVKNPFERVNFEVRTIITVFGEYNNGKYYFNKFNLNISYIETGDEKDWSYTILIKHLGEVVYDSKSHEYISNSWETMLDVMFNVSYKVLELRDKNKIKSIGKIKND